uniref:Uncharacterized protein n=1 Tax=Knipowitschia caucasica TaxID=637954 RepID=A0AAV2K2L0_KNICA
MKRLVQRGRWFLPEKNDQPLSRPFSYTPKQAPPTIGGIAPSSSLTANFLISVSKRPAIFPVLLCDLPAGERIPHSRLPDSNFCRPASSSLGVPFGEQIRNPQYGSARHLQGSS